ncbi:MarR family winged helix-turn-helix transcriptional regulator [Haliscomenobacter hydrossis]|uniref:Regulatory protein MarR n=1 Tax=Haliscomenobacter hydrossis (strain ATCC 27775 / DSM 1100 / LMG 10767 / O) TaxID=760192 RepID=F4KX79_HALH1|nr:MarR family winged helix-turn-helix transcriptional regulator [Haliscomenobacter hydrossis]AEE48307.1 regulatory protein MarR [Haliscomenobacter hydrossis DSM 1100]
MNKTVQIVNEWGAFEAAHPHAEIEEFCRYYLTAQRAKLELGENFSGKGTPPTAASYLMKLIGYIARLFELYITRAMSDVPEIKQAEDFYFLNNISHSGECRKTEVAHQQLLGVSTGIDTLNRLLAHGLIEERTDPSDKRARLVSVTEKGIKILHECYRRAAVVNDLIFTNLSEDDLKLCIQLLRGVEAKHAALALEVRELPILEMYEKVLGHKPDSCKGQ